MYLVSRCCFRLYCTSTLCLGSFIMEPKRYLDLPDKTQFPRFQEFPRELRNLVWEFASHERRGIQLSNGLRSQRKDGSFTHTPVAYSSDWIYKPTYVCLDTHPKNILDDTEHLRHQSQIPSILHTSSEARFEGLHYYTLCSEMNFLDTDPTPLFEHLLLFLLFGRHMAPPSVRIYLKKSVYINFDIDVFTIASDGTAGFNFQLEVIKRIQNMCIGTTYLQPTWRCLRKLSTFERSFVRDGFDSLKHVTVVNHLGTADYERYSQLPKGPTCHTEREFLNWWENDQTLWQRSGWLIRVFRGHLGAGRWHFDLRRSDAYRTENRIACGMDPAEPTYRVVWCRKIEKNPSKLGKLEKAPMDVLRIRIEYRQLMILVALWFLISYVDVWRLD